MNGPAAGKKKKGPGSREGNPAGLVLPAMVVVGFLLVALAIIAVYSFHPSGGMGAIGAEFTARNYTAFFFDSHFLGYLLRSIRVSVYGTIAALLFGYPTAYVMVRSTSGVKRFLTLLLVTQFFTFTIIRIYAAMLVLGNHGIINSFLLQMHLISAPLKLMYNELGVGIGLFLGSMPYMVFCVSSVLENIDRNWEDAARSLGADRRRTFFRITLPLSLPGIIAGVVIVFLWNVISYITPALLGGGFFDMIANFVFNQALNLFDYPFAATGAIIMLLLTFAVVFLIHHGLERLIRGVRVNR